jgi:hypothetical protein
VARDRTGAAGLAPKGLLTILPGRPAPTTPRPWCPRAPKEWDRLENLQEEAIILKGASVGLLVLGIVFITQAETRLVGIFWLLAAAALAGWEWRRRNSTGKTATSPEAKAQGPPARGSKPT